MLAGLDTIDITDSNTLTTKTLNIESVCKLTM